MTESTSNQTNSTLEIAESPGDEICLFGLIFRYAKKMLSGDMRIWTLCCVCTKKKFWSSIAFNLITRLEISFQLLVGLIFIVFFQNPRKNWKMVLKLTKWQRFFWKYDKSTLSKKRLKIIFFCQILIKFNLLEGRHPVSFMPAK